LTLSREDLEAKARQLVDAVDETKASVQNKAMIAAIAVGVLVAAAFVIGRRRGSRNKTVVEVYRV
jgi:hypothetical protein